MILCSSAQAVQHVCRSPEFSVLHAVFCISSAVAGACEAMGRAVGILSLLAEKMSPPSAKTKKLNTKAIGKSSGLGLLRVRGSFLELGMGVL